MIVSLAHHKFRKGMLQAAQRYELAAALLDDWPELQQQGYASAAKIRKLLKRPDHELFVVRDLAAMREIIDDSNDAVQKIQVAEGMSK